MSLDALAWARAQRVGSPQAKHVLCMISAYADHEGKCWPSRKRLAEDTEYSIDTIDRRLRDLEDLGFIRREAPNGRQDAVKLIFLLFDVDRADAEMAANRTGKPTKVGPQNAPPPAEGGPQSYAAPGPQLCGPEESLRVNEESPSSSSVHARHESEEEEEEDLRIDMEFSDLVKAYPTHDDMDLAVARRLFEALKVKERQLAIRMVCSKIGMS